MFKNRLEIVPIGGSNVSILSDANFEKEVFCNKIWHRGNAAELAQFYGTNDDMVGNKSFWAAGNTSKSIRKLHSGLPGLVVDVLADIAVTDLLGVKLSTNEAQAVWDKIAADNNFNRLLGRAVRKALSLGDGAFKISFDTEVSLLPIIEFFGADRVSYVYKRGRVAEVIFKQIITQGREKYALEEVYSKDGIDYRLYNEKGKEADLAAAKNLHNLQAVRHNLGKSLAVPLIFGESVMFEGRGKSVFEGKLGAFDALDEVLSQWVDALRDGRAQKYIPIGLLPRNPYNGTVAAMGTFENRFVQTEMDMAEGADNSIKLVQPTIDTTALLAGCTNYLNFALQGIISPSTLGIDLKTRDNAEAQREKEKTTLYTRSKIITVLRDVIAQLAVAAVGAYNAFYNEPSFDDVTATVEFGEYAAPNFESQIEAIGKGRQMGIISVETAVEQLYGATWSKEAKEEEVKRLRLMEENYE